jgi:hypothetical protein
MTRSDGPNDDLEARVARWPDQLRDSFGTHCQSGSLACVED